MTSAITTGQIDQNYPTPGINNSSQGFRTNFTAIKTGLNTAATEISDLQSKAVLKSALTGTTLNNDMANALISNALVGGFRHTTYNLGNNLTGTANIDCTAGDVQYGTVTGNVTLNFNKWAPAGTYGTVQTILTVTPGQQITIGANASNIYGGLTLENVDSNAYANGTLSFTVPSGVTRLHHQWTSTDCGTTVEVQALDRPRRINQVLDTVPANLVGPANITARGANGDRAGDVRIYNGNLWICTANYDGTAAIWGSFTPTSPQTSITNGNSNIVVVANGNITLSSTGNANILTVSGNSVTIANSSSLIANVTQSNISNANTINVTGSITANAAINANSLSVTNLGSFGSILTGAGAIIGGVLSVNSNANITGNINAANFVNGNSNIRIAANSSVTISSTGNANVLTVSGTGASILGNLTASNANLGNLVTANYLTGNLVNGSSSISIAANGNITLNTAGGSAELTLTSSGANIFGYANIAGDLTVSNITSNGNMIMSGNITLTAPGNGITLNSGNINNANVGTFTTVNVTANATIANLTSANANITGGILRGNLSLSTSAPPAGNSSTGTAGQIAYDTNYIYVCTGTNTWRRALLSTW